MLPRQPRSPLFPYTTLFRSGSCFDSVDPGAPRAALPVVSPAEQLEADRKSTRLNSSHTVISYAVFCLKKKKKKKKKVALARRARYKNSCLSSSIPYYIHDTQ